MVKATARKPQAGADILKFQIRQLLNNLLKGQAVGKKIQHVANPNPHPTNTGPPSALLWVHCDPM